MKKVISVLFLSLFMMSMTSTKITNESIKEDDCIDIGFFAIELAYNMGYDTDVAQCLGNTVYASCVGYQVDINSCFN